MAVGILALADLLGTEQVNAASWRFSPWSFSGTASRPRGRLISVSAVRFLSGLEVSQVHAEARRATEARVVVERLASIPVYDGEDQ